VPVQCQEFSGLNRNENPSQKCEKVEQKDTDRRASPQGSVANNLFTLKKVEYPIIAKTRCVGFTGFFELVGE
jgi:hypothetical protein